MELVIEDAVVTTMAPGGGTAGAMLVRDGRIAAVGDPAEVRAAAGPGAQVARLDGATVIPGLIDAHCHVADIGYLAAGADCSQPAAPDIPAIQARLREASTRTPAGSWVTGSGYVEYRLRESRHPTRDDLDQAVPDRPAVLYHTSLHACVLNSAALRAAGFADRQPDPPGGAFGRDREGRLDGVVFEAPMFALLAGNMRADITRMDAAERARLMDRAGQHLAALGITAACDADLRRATFAAFAEADQAGALHQRIYGLVVHDQVDWLLAEGLQGRHSARLATEAVKIWADGGMSSRTAAIHGTYPVPPYGSGILFFTRDELTAMVREFDARGFQVAVHAQGDRAIETVLDAYAAVLADTGLADTGLADTGLAGSPAPSGARRNPLRHRIEHAGAMYPPLTARAAELGIVIVSQPGFLSILGDGFAAAFPGREDQLYAFGSWRRAGLTVAGSSDAPVISAAPLLGLRDAMARRTAGGQVLGPGERLTARDALALYTTQAAAAMHRENEIGSLEPGKLADFVVLADNPLAGGSGEGGSGEGGSGEGGFPEGGFPEGGPGRVADIPVLATVVDGAPTYQSGDILGPWR